MLEGGFEMVYRKKIAVVYYLICQAAYLLVQILDMSFDASRRELLRYRLGRRYMTVAGGHAEQQGAHI